MDQPTNNSTAHVICSISCTVTMCIYTHLNMCICMYIIIYIIIYIYYICAHLNMIAYLKILRPWNMNARAANTHCTSESRIRNGMMSRIHNMARSSRMFCQCRKYSKRTSFALRRKEKYKRFHIRSAFFFANKYIL